MISYVSPTQLPPRSKSVHSTTGSDLWSPATRSGCLEVQSTIWRITAGRHTPSLQPMASPTRLVLALAALGAMAASSRSSDLALSRTSARKATIEVGKLSQKAPRCSGVGHGRLPVLPHGLAVRGGGGGAAAKVISTTNAVLQALDLVGTGVFAFSGTVAAGTRGMDVFGCLVVAAVTAVGGGSVRDALLGRTPVFWAKDLRYLKIITATSLATFVLWPILEDFGVETNAWPLAAADILGIGAFVVMGSRIALEQGLGPLAVMVVAVMTSTFGGVLRDVLCRRPVRILHSESTMYATPVALGAAVYMALHHSIPGELGEAVAAIGAYSFTVALLTAAEVYGLRLPHWLKHPMPQWQQHFSVPETSPPSVAEDRRTPLQGFSLNTTATKDAHRNQAPTVPGPWGVVDPLPEDMRVSRGGASNKHSWGRRRTSP